MGRIRTHIVAAALGGLSILSAAAPAAADPPENEAELPDPSELGAAPPAAREKREQPDDEQSDDADGADEGAAPTPSEGTPASPSPDDPVPLPDRSTDRVPGASDEKGWRVKADRQPPIQVQRAVRAVSTRAEAVADSIGGGERAESSAEDAESTESDSEATEKRDRARVRRLGRRATEPSEAEAPKDSASDELLDSVRRIFREKRQETLELEPYVEDPRWNRAMQMLVDDQCRKALDRVDTVLEESDRDLKQIPAVRYAVARIKLCAGQPAEGRKTLQELKARDDVVGELAHRRLGGGPTPVESEDDETTWSDRLARARNLAADGELADALEHLGSLRGELEHAWQRYKVRMTEVNLLLREGRVAEAGRSLVGIYRMVRDWEIGDRVADKIERVENRHGVEILSLPARVDRMRELILQGEYHKAHQVSIENADLAGVGGQEIEGWSLYRRALEAEHKRRREHAAELFERAERRVDSPVIRSRLYFGWARALRRLDRDERAIELYERLCREYPRHHLCDDARFEIGRLHQYQGNHERARQAFTDLVGLHPEAEDVPHALWRGAFSAYLMEDYHAVDPPLRQIIEYYPDETDASGLALSLKARYWRAVAAYKRGEIEVAERRFQETINEGALTWYGRLAARRMERIGAKPVVPKPQRRLDPNEIHSLATLKLPDRPRYRTAVAYARLGLYEDAIAEMKRLIDSTGGSEESRRFLANLQLVNGETATAHWSMQERIDSASPTGANLRDWGLAYPVEYSEHARRYATKFDVSPYLIQGVIRQESGFRPSVSSGVGAVGLMQIMPGSANVISDDFFDGGHISRSELRQPETNLRLGTAYVRAMVAWVRGRVPMALAGYNAGPAPLKDWFERYGDREIDAWVESITYRQARGYVRKVYTSYTRYAALYSGTLPDIRLKLPQDFREWGDVPSLRQTDPSSDPISLLMDLR